jgi:tetratricopeptide (TPR) repeat protein
LAQLVAEHNNLRAAHEWASEDRDRSEVEVRLVGALSYFWIVLGYMDELRRWLNTALERVDMSQPALHAPMLLAAGMASTYEGDLQQGTALYQRSLSLYQDSGDRESVAFALTELGFVMFLQGDYQQAQRYLEESLALQRELGLSHNIIWSLLRLADIYRDRGEYEAAFRLLEEALARSRDVRHKEVEAWALVNLGRVAYRLGNPEQAMAYSQQGLAVFRDLKYQYGIAETLIDLGDIAHAREDDLQALAFYRESLTLIKNMGNVHYTHENIERLAGLLGRQQQPKRAVQLFAAIEHYREQKGIIRKSIDHPRYAQDLAAARAQLDQETFATAWERGSRLSLDQAIDEALAISEASV